MSLTPPASVQKLRNSLHAKAKGSPATGSTHCTTRYRADVLAHAYDCCRANKGTAEWTAGRLRTSRSTGWSDGWATPTRAEGQVVRSLGGASVWIPKPTASKDRWESRRSRIAWRKWRGAGLGADLRGRPAAGAIRVSTSAQRPGRVSHVRTLLQTGHCQVVDAT